MLLAVVKVLLKKVTSLHLVCRHRHFISTSFVELSRTCKIKSKQNKTKQNKCEMNAYCSIYSFYFTCLGALK